MPDVHDPVQRRRNMAAIRGRDTRPEREIRKGLHAAGFRFRLQDRRLPGRPDLVLSRWRAVIFVQGCFWHMHDCRSFRWPQSRAEFWQEKLQGNRARDLRVQSELQALGWRVALVWECALKGPGRLAPGEVIGRIGSWLRSDAAGFEISGQD